MFITKCCTITDFKGDKVGINFLSQFVFHLFRNLLLENLAQFINIEMHVTFYLDNSIVLFNFSTAAHFEVPYLQENTRNFT